MEYTLQAETTPTGTQLTASLKKPLSSKALPHPPQKSSQSLQRNTNLLGVPRTGGPGKPTEFHFNVETS